MLRILPRVFAVLAIGLFLMVGVKSCIVTVWPAPEEVTTYHVTGEDNRTMTIVLHPSHHAYVLYDDPNEPSTEIVLSRWRGTFGTHYVGPLWNVGEEGDLFGLRVYQRPLEPVVMEIEILDKARRGRGKSSFAEVGGRTRSTVVFAPESLRFSGMWLRQVPTDMALVEALREQVPLPRD